MREAEDIEGAMKRHGDAVLRACMMRCRNDADAQDVFQDVFLKYAQHHGEFNDQEHCKAWLLCVAINACKDRYKKASTRDSSLDERREAGFDVADKGDTGVVREVLEAVRSLGDPPRAAVYLALYEGYPATEVARMLDAPVNTVYSWIARGRKSLQEVLA